MNFLSSLSRKLGFIGGEEDDRSEELEENELEDEETDEDEEEEGVERRSFLPFRLPFGVSGRRKQQAYEDGMEETEEPEERSISAARMPRRNNVIHDARMSSRVQEFQYTHCERIVNVRQIEECRDIIRCLLQGESILLNLENIDPKDCGRVVDLLSGAAFALQGRMIKIAHLAYLLAPEVVEIIEQDIYATNRMRYNR